MTEEKQKEIEAIERRLEKIKASNTKHKKKADKLRGKWRWHYLHYSLTCEGIKKWEAMLEGLRFGEEQEP